MDRNRLILFGVIFIAVLLFSAFVLNRMLTDAIGNLGAAAVLVLAVFGLAAFALSRR